MNEIQYLKLTDIWSVFSFSNI